MKLTTHTDTIAGRAVLRLNSLIDAIEYAHWKRQKVKGLPDQILISEEDWDLIMEALSGVRCVSDCGTLKTEEQTDGE